MYRILKEAVGLTVRLFLSPYHFKEHPILLLTSERFLNGNLSEELLLVNLILQIILSWVLLYLIVLRRRSCVKQSMKVVC
uniref:Uncharacterized protein n=1 Tax=Rhizophora mucronata TaxID=61149 RepID=A0A2P2JTD2_RHIMU